LIEQKLEHLLARWQFLVWRGDVKFGAIASREQNGFDVGSLVLPDVERSSDLCRRKRQQFPHFKRRRPMIQTDES
jgi:hypothetical protein